MLVILPKLSGFASEGTPCERLVAPNGKIQLNAADVSGKSSWARLNMSKAAIRNCNRVFSLSGNSLNNVASYLLKPGERKGGCSNVPNFPRGGSETEAGLTQEPLLTPVKFAPLRGLVRITGKMPRASLPYHWRPSPMKFEQRAKLVGFVSPGEFAQ